MPRSEFPIVFDRLRRILRQHSKDLVVVIDTTDNYYLDTAHIMKNKKPLNFGSVRIMKNYVSYHLMPIYVFRKLLQDASPELRKRMQGKSCFNFSSVDETLFSELSALTVAGLAEYRNVGYV